MTGPSACDEEQGLVAAAIRGEEAAWRRIVLRYGRAISAKISQVYLRRTERNATEIERPRRSRRWPCLHKLVQGIDGLCRPQIGWGR